MQPINTLFFDLDGTLTDNYASITGCIIHALVHLGGPAPDAAAGCGGRNTARLS
jgi:phosphoglycolate phosphatase-like HAD superfamily hydrolase